MKWARSPLRLGVFLITSSFCLANMSNAWSLWLQPCDLCFHLWPSWPFYLGSFACRGEYPAAMPLCRDSAAMLSSRGMYPDSSRAVKENAKLLKSFLERHGFEDANRPRCLLSSGESSGRIQMSPVYPIEVAMELDNMAIVQLLLDAGATYPTMGWKTSICSWLGMKGGLGARRSDLKDDSVVKPLRSCLAGDRTNEIVLMQGNHGASEEKCQTGTVVSVHL
eukprot:s1603_g3.t1